MGLDGRKQKVGFAKKNYAYSKKWYIVCIKGSMSTPVVTCHNRPRLTAPAAAVSKLRFRLRLSLAWSCPQYAISDGSLAVSSVPTCGRALCVGRYLNERAVGARYFFVIIRNKPAFFGGGSCPKTSDSNTWILQSESLNEFLVPYTGKKPPLMVFKPHFISTDTYKLKVEKTIKGVLGRPGGV